MDMHVPFGVFRHISWVGAGAGLFGEVVEPVVLGSFAGSIGFTVQGSGIPADVIFHRQQGSEVSPAAGRQSAQFDQPRNWICRFA